jgi:hypothetical protein
MSHRYRAALSMAAVDINLLKQLASPFHKHIWHTLIVSSDARLTPFEAAVVLICHI